MPSIPPPVSCPVPADTPLAAALRAYALARRETPDAGHRRAMHAALVAAWGAVGEAPTGRGARDWRWRDAPAGAACPCEKCRAPERKETPL